MLVPTYSAPLASEKPHTEFIFAMRQTVRCLTIFDDDLEEATKAEVVNVLRAIQRKCCWKSGKGIWEGNVHASPLIDSRKRETEVESQERRKEIVIFGLAIFTCTRC